MIHIKLVLILFLSVVYYNEANGQSAIDKTNGLNYFLKEKQSITDLFNRPHLYHTQISCYLCILAEINEQLELIQRSPKNDKSSKFRIEIYKDKSENWKNYCEKGMPTDTRKSFFDIYTTVHYKTSLPRKKAFVISDCIKLFTRGESSITDFDKIKQRYQDDYLSHEIFQNQVDANVSNKNCMNCIKDFVNYEQHRWYQIEPTVRSSLNYGKMITAEHQDTMRDIFINYNRYIDAVQSWITTCSSTSTNDIMKNFQSGLEFQKINPLISHGKSERMEECIYHYINEKRYRNLLASTGKKVNSENEVETKVTELIRQITY
ncbi:uncharacterized protein LOC142334114 isoform X2 [Lycorma delicatula]|uniref:uncharacterized protein LOC142334114 isoform X2 n=1 Tax=Lycorma delicatula TaxID=130591 RepID=UPI003F51900E